jgi:hypothetical protein
MRRAAKLVQAGASIAEPPLEGTVEVLLGADRRAATGGPTVTARRGFPSR